MVGGLSRVVVPVKRRMFPYWAGLDRRLGGHPGLTRKDIWI